MDGFKDTTRMKYMMGGDVKAYKTGGAVKKAMCGGPVKKMRGGMMDEGVSTRPTTDSGRRMTNEELGMTPGGVDPAKKKPMPKGAGMMAAALAASKKVADITKKGVPSYRDRPMIRRKTGGLTAMPKGKC